MRRAEADLDRAGLSSSSAAGADCRRPSHIAGYRRPVERLFRSSSAARWLCDQTQGAKDDLDCMARDRDPPAIAWFRRRAEETAERGPGGMKESLARAGAVGGTARWAAKGYKFFRQRYPEREGISDQNVFRLMIGHRYQTLSDDEAERTLLAQADRMQSLSQLVVAILRIEAGFDESTLENRQLFTDVIEEELLKADVPDDLVSARGLAPKANPRPRKGPRGDVPSTGQSEQSASEAAGDRLKSGDQASSVPPSNRVEEDRVLVSRGGDEMEVSVSRVASGCYRIEDLFRFSFWADEEVPEEAGVGWLLEVEELQDGRLRVMDVVPDPSVDSIGGLTFLY